MNIDGVSYLIGEHPMAPGVPYGQEGRQGIVYQLIPEQGSADKKALKVFRQQFRNPKMVYLSEKLGMFSTLPGLSVCERTVLTPELHSDLLSTYQDFIYAVIMPWIEGSTWLDLIVEKHKLSRQESLMLACSLAKVLSRMEQRGLAHGDLSGANILFIRQQDKQTNKFTSAELVDVEQLYAPGFEKPDLLLSGSFGYASTTSQPLWGEYADRFAGAILLAEILGWYDESIRELASGESYFAPEDLQQNSERYQLLIQSIRKHWGEKMANLLEQAWNSDEPEQCPSFGEWLTELMACQKQSLAESGSLDVSESEQEEEQHFTGDIYYKQIEVGIELEKKGDLNEALKVYRAVLRNIPSQNNIAQELIIMIEVLEKKILILKQESAVPFTQKIKRFWMVFALITILLIGVGGYYYWFPLSSSQADASSAIEQARNIVNKQNEVVRKNNEMIQSYDVINRKANEMQLSIRSGVTPDKQKAGEIVTQLKQIKPKIAAYQVKVNQLKSMTETASSGSNPSYVKFYQSVLELVHAYEAYENVLQKVADSDLHYFETLASGKKPVPDHFNQLLQNEKNSFVKCNDLEEKMMLEWKKLTDSYSSKHLNDPI